ncbi:hypothetical protein MNBD_GAMMA07-1783 [hydrothermal vent metagenome]|uniref:Uncharacterized protein n=1 Tax=hydrothermal vent metagenome TaxID=652676 RepID=A0A3B0WCW0_9ZZZZ
MFLSQQQVIKQHKCYSPCHGAVFSDISFGFMPAFKNLNDEHVHLSRDHYGKVSVMHLFDGLPESWIKEKDAQGAAITLKSEIIVGFLRNATFYTLSEIMNDIRDS